jgi:hypothetical protein
MNSFFISVGEYAAAIEQTTGTEIYGPIMRAGIFIFISSFVLAFLAAFIVLKSNSWESKILQIYYLLVYSLG